MIDVFVYGTLKPGEVNYSVCAKWVVATRQAIAPGHLYHLPLGYPAMIPGNGFVQGFILSFADAQILTLLDEFEQHDPAEFCRWMPQVSLSHSQYQRQSIETFDQQQTQLSTAWAYLMTFKQVKSLGGVLLPSGQWRSCQ